LEERRTKDYFKRIVNKWGSRLEPVHPLSVRRGRKRKITSQSAKNPIGCSARGGVKKNKNKMETEKGKKRGKKKDNPKLNQ